MLLIVDQTYVFSLTQHFISSKSFVLLTDSVMASHIAGEYEIPVALNQAYEDTASILNQMNL